MKKFNFSKGLVIGLLTLALVLTGFATVKASAAAGDSHTITFQAKVGNDNKGTYEVTYKEGTAKEVTLADVLDKLGKADECLYVQAGDPSIPNDKGVSFANSKFSIADTAKEDVTVTVGVKSPVVTFNVTVTDMLQTEKDEGGAYTFTADTSFQKARASITDAAILEAMKKSSATLSDPTAWVVKSVTKQDTKFTYANGKFSLVDNLADNLTIEVAVTNSKVPVTFVYPDANGFKATILVDNKIGEYKIPFMDIVDSLKKKVSGEDKTYAEVTSEVAATKGITEYIIPKDGIAAGTKTDGKYSTWNYKYTIADTLVSTAPTAVEITSIVPAFVSQYTGYDPDTDSIRFVSTVDLDVYWTDCKKAAGVSVKGDKLSTLSLKENKINDDPLKGKFVGYISLTDKSAGVKVAESKTAYIYASFKAPAADKTKYTANYIVEATPYKKIAVTFNYAWAEKDKTDQAIATLTTIDTKKKTIVYSGVKNAETNPDYYLIESVAAGANPAVYSKIFEALQYSTDGTTWYKIVDNPLVNSKPANDLNLGKLYELINGSKTTLYFRIKGAAATPDDASTADEDETANAYRASKLVKVAVDVAKAGKAVKVDVSKGTIALKNGYDFTMTAKEKDTPALATNPGNAPLAYTILPFNKDGKYTVTDNEGNEVTGDTRVTLDYIPAAKVTENPLMFTKTKVKSYSIDDIVTLSGSQIGVNISGNGNLYIWVRKSATTKKPAEQWTLVTVSQMAAAPTIKEDKNKFYSVQDVADTKGVVLTPEVKNASSDKNSGAFEYLIVDASDIVLGADSKYHADIDLTSAKWTTLNDKGLTVGKSKSKYAKEEGKKASDHVLKDGSAVLVRRAGDKSSNILASDYLVTMIAKADVEIEVEKDGKKEKETKSLFVWKAYSAN